MKAASVKLYIGSVWQEPGYGGGDGWTPFGRSQDDARALAADLDCEGCMERLYAQLAAGDEAVETVRAGRCVKAVAVLPSEEACVEVVEAYAMSHADRPFHGKFGRGAGFDTWALIVYADKATEAAVVRDLGECARAAYGDARVISTRGCANLHGEVLGPSDSWGVTSRVTNPDRVPVVLGRLERMLGIAAQEGVPASAV